MWGLQEQQFIHYKAFEQYCEMLGTTLSVEQVENIKVDINKDPEGYEKLRQTMIGFFDDMSGYYVDKLKYVGLKDFDAVMDLVKSFIRVANNIGGQNLQLVGFNSGRAIRELVSYKKPKDFENIGELKQLKKIATKSVLTVQEIFSFIHFEFKAWLSYDDRTNDNFNDLIKAVFQMFDYGTEGVRKQRSLVKSIVDEWLDLSNDGTDILDYEDIRNHIYEETSNGSGANSPLKSIYRSIINIVVWITNDRQYRNRAIAGHNFMKYLQQLVNK